MNSRLVKKLLSEFYALNFLKQEYILFLRLKKEPEIKTVAKNTLKYRDFFKKQCNV